MSKIKEGIGSDLKSAISDEIMNVNSFDVDPVEGMKSLNDFTRDISEDEEDEVKEEGSETTEATSAGGSGQYSQPLFSGEEPKKIEATEATSSASAGQYSTPAFVAKNSKNWRGNKKPQIPGGKFVKIKDKCKKFPYCNQGDIKALKLFENDTVKKAISNICEKFDVSENVVKSIIVHEYENKILNK